MVIETGSASCPMYVKNIEPMNALAYRFPEVEFLLLYVPVNPAVTQVSAR